MAKRRKRSPTDDTSGFGFDGLSNIEDALNFIFSGAQQQQHPGQGHDHSHHQQSPKPEYGIQLKTPRTVLELCQLLSSIGFQVMYPEAEAATHIAELHGINAIVTTARGDTKQVFIAFTGFQKPPG